MPGPPPKPTALKKLAGNPGKRPLNKAEPQPPKPDKLPYAPRHLNREAKREWRRMTKLLMDMKLYTEVDRAALAMYCQSWGRWVEMETELNTRDHILVTEKGYEYQNPYFGLAAKYWEQMRKTLSRFGLSPADRARLALEKPEEEDDELSALFRRRVKVTSG